MMSRMNGSQAIQAALDAAAQRMEELVVIRLAADEEAACALSGRRLTLPVSDDAQLGFCGGCCAAGMRVVLDLTGLRDGTHRLERAWAALKRLPAGLIIRARDRHCPALQGVRVLRPGNSRECAAAVRQALSSAENCLILEDPLKAFEVCEVPQEELMPGAPLAEVLPQEPIPAEDTARPDEATAQEPSAAEVMTDEPMSEPVSMVAGFACRIRHYDPSELNRTAQLLNISPEALATRCCRGLTEGVDVTLELDAQPGEVALTCPAGGGASLWIGGDRISLCWQGGMTRDGAKALLAGVISALELPARLIME